MGDIFLSKIEGFSFDGTHISSIEGVFLKAVEKNLTPALRHKTFVVPKRHGSYKHKDSYEDIKIRVTLIVDASREQDKKLIARKLISPWLSKKGRLIFDDEPTLFYEGEILDQVEFKEENLFDEISIIFTCSPFKYEIYQSARDISLLQARGMSIKNMEGMRIDCASWNNITTNISKPILNSGNFEALPLIKISGTASNISMTFKEHSFNLVNQSTTTYIDSEKMIVYQISNGKKVSKLIDFYGNFPKIPVGESSVSIAGSSMNISIEVLFKSPYLI